MKFSVTCIERCNSPTVKLIFCQENAHCNPLIFRIEDLEYRVNSVYKVNQPFCKKQIIIEAEEFQNSIELILTKWTMQDLHTVKICFEESRPHRCALQIFVDIEHFGIPQFSKLFQIKKPVYFKIQDLPPPEF